MPRSVLAGRALALGALISALAAACSDTDPPPAHSLFVVPDEGPDELSISLEIHGEGFVRGVRTDFSNPESSRVDSVVSVRLGEYSLIDARIVSSTLITAKVPMGLPITTYDLIVTDGSNRVITVPTAFKVRATMCSDVAMVAPGDCAACGMLQGCGCDATSSCIPTCGDGVMRLPETCDDGNLDNSDGCSSACEAEPGYVCAGRPSVCHTVCGDGVRMGDEACDDMNIMNGDGCSSICAVEYGFHCSGELGEMSLCTPICGDGELGPGEDCDDLNTIAGDGCDAACAIESGFVCPTPGLACQAVCGDALVRGPEGCDDGNHNSGDGCSDRCAMEIGFVCPLAGQPCTPICGDSMRVSGEACDDGNVSDGDGCSAACALEPGWSCPAVGPCTPVCGDALVVGSEACDDGNTASGDGCTAACTTEVGYTCPPGGGACHETCGDSMIIGRETCDDGNGVAGDGCSATCAIEAGWSCAGAPGARCTSICGDSLRVGLEGCDDGNHTSGDGCTSDCALEPGWSCPTPGQRCVTVCGDAIVAGHENCDDGNVMGGDGCSASCATERGYTCATAGQPCVTTCGDGIRAGLEACDDGNVIGGDGCTLACTLETGYACTIEGRPCTPICGDSRVVGSETCDDGNTTSGDGCSVTCATERGFSCGTPGTACFTTCGDGVRAGAEGCDDGNAASGDGCSHTCAIETGYTCALENHACTPICGDRMIVGGEGCDDGNAAGGDGCSTTCQIEAGFSCPTAGSACVAICGDGLVLGTEACDDGNLTNGDGCTNACAVEPGWGCPNAGLPCLEICGDGLRVGHEGCDDGNHDFGDGCSELCAVEAGFRCDTPGAMCTAICGDGLVRGAELCDDHNLIDGDGCDSDCRPTCGNGRLDAGEVCDDGNYVSGDACEADCTLPRCGNGIFDLSEECDDGNAVNGDGCDTNCTASRCGNGVAASGEECDDGNANDEDGCRADCRFTSANSALFGDGTYTQWTPSIDGAFHFSMITPGCNVTTNVSSTTVGRRDSYPMAVTGVPIGAVITDLEVTPCAATVSSGSARFSMFYILNGVQSADMGDYFLSSTTQTSQAPLRFSGLNTPRSPSTTLQIGVVLTGGTAGVAISGMSFRIMYYVRPFPPPDGFTAVHAGNGDVDLSWNDTTFWEDGFYVERSIGNDQLWMPATRAPANATSRRDGFLPENQTFYYRMRAEDSVSTAVSDWSATVRVVTATEVPRAPRNLGLQTDGTGAISLLWVDASHNEEGFSLERSEDGVSFTETATLAPDTTSYLDTCTALVCSYRIRAYNELGYSSFSNVASTSPPPPSGPDLGISMSAVGSSISGLQLTTVTITYSNNGAADVHNAGLSLIVPLIGGGNFLAQNSSLGWQCHHLDADYYRLLLTVGRALRALRFVFPNLQQVFLSSPQYYGFAPPTSDITEPYAFEAGLAVKRVIQAQIDQARTGEIDPVIGDLDYQGGRVAWTSWGPYLWSAGPFTNGYHFNYLANDYTADRLRLAPSGLAKTTTQFMNYMFSRDWTTWFRTASETATNYTVPVALPALPQRPALIDMTSLTATIADHYYQGLEGGLFEGLSDTIPADHAAGGIAAALAIQRRGTDGTPSPTGKIVFLGIGPQGGADVMDAFITSATADARTQASSTLAIVDGGAAGGWAGVWAEPTGAFYDTVRARLGTNDPRQVQAVWFQAANQANPSLVNEMGSDTSLTHCGYDLGTIPAGTTGTVVFAVITHFQRSTALSFPVVASEDGTGGTDLDPFNNLFELTFAPSICHRPGGPGCDRCAEGLVCPAPQHCDPRIGCVP